MYRYLLCVATSGSLGDIAYLTHSSIRYPTSSPDKLGSIPITSPSPVASISSSSLHGTYPYYQQHLRFTALMVILCVPRKEDGMGMNFESVLDDEGAPVRYLRIISLTPSFASMDQSLIVVLRTNS